MIALRFRVLRWTASHPRSIALLTLVVAVVGSVVIGLAAGARRTATAPDRFAESFGTEASVNVMQERGMPLDVELAALSGVRSVEAMTFVFGGIVPAELPEGADVLVFSGSHLASGAQLVAGRAPEPAQPNEFVASSRFAAASGMGIGDTAQLLAIDQADSAAYGFDPTRAKPVSDAVLVGIIEAPVTLDGFDEIAVFPRSLIAAGDGRIGISATVMTLALDDGVTLADLSREVGTLPQPENFTLTPIEIVSMDTRAAVRGQSLGLWTLAIMSMAAAIAAVGQVLARNVRLAADETTPLESLGYTRTQIVVEQSVRAGIPVAAGSLLSVAIAIALSPLFPIGFARDLEPTPGLDVELLVLVAAWLVFVAGLVGWVALATNRRPRSSPTGRATAIDAVTSVPAPALWVGTQFAFGSNARGRSAAAVVGGALLVASLVGTITFGVSARRLVQEPARYGMPYDILTDNGADRVPPEILDLLMTDADISDVTLFASGGARTGDVSIPVLGMEVVRGHVLPYLLDGRFPSDAHEAAIGRRSSRQLHLGIGDLIDLSMDGTSSSYRITGLVIPPGIQGNDVVGNGVLLTSTGYAVLAPDQVPQAAGVEIRHTAPGAALERIATALGMSLVDTEHARPPSILSLARITFVPFALSVILAALAVVVVVNVLYTGVRRHDRQVAVLRALGADSAWLRRVVGFQALASTVTPAAIGVPVGLIVGRSAFSSFAIRQATATGAALPLLPVCALFTSIVVVGVAVALIAGRRGRCLAPASLLKTA